GRLEAETTTLDTALSGTAVRSKHVSDPPPPPVLGARPSASAARGGDLRASLRGRARPRGRPGPSVGRRGRRSLALRHRRHHRGLPRAPRARRGQADSRPADRHAAHEPRRVRARPLALRRADEHADARAARTRRAADAARARTRPAPLGLSAPAARGARGTRAARAARAPAKRQTPGVSTRHPLRPDHLHRPVEPALRRRLGRRPRAADPPRARSARAVTDVATPERKVRRLVVGRPMRTGQIDETLLPKWLALPIFASDPLSSVAYATESALVVLIGVSAASAHYVFPIAIAISVLLAIVIVSYIQTVLVYETSGGAYIVARENLGTLPSVVAAAALLTDYVLTLAVSISAGIFAITSFVPSVGSHKVALSLACLLVIVLANLRGVRESGLVFALPTYLFVAAMGTLVVGGLVELATGHAHDASTPNALPAGTG